MTVPVAFATVRPEAPKGLGQIQPPKGSLANLREATEDGKVARRSENLAVLLVHEPCLNPSMDPT